MGDLIPTNISLPAHLQRRNAAASITAIAAGGLTSGSAFPKISIRASRFHLVEEGTTTTLPDLYLSTVIVGANPRVSKTFYAAQYDGSDEPKAPDCYSLDGIKPAADATSQQSSLCANCPKNAWGSKITPQGKQAKACADKKRLAVLPADDPHGSIYLLEVTPSAFPDFAQYVRNLQVRNIHVETVRTQIGFDNKASFPKLTFQFGGFLDEAGQEAVDARLDEPVIKEITGEALKEAEEEAVYQRANPSPTRPVSVVAAPEPAPAPTGKSFGKKAAPEPAPVVAEPAKGGFGKKAAAPKATPKPAPVEEPVEAPAAKAASLSDEIAALIGNLDDDD